jgi:hypothetical protein
MARSLMSPGYHLPRSGRQRADIIARLLLLAVTAGTALIMMSSLWLAGQLGGLLSNAAWPQSGPGDAPRVTFGVIVHPGDPQSAWPAPARDDLPPAGLLYPLWTVLFTALAAGAGVPALRIARRTVRRRGFASRSDLNRVVTASAVLARADVVRPALTVTEADDEPTARQKQQWRQDPLQVARLLGYHTISGQPLYLANEYTELIAGSPRFANKTSRYIIPRAVDSVQARAALISTSTRLDVVETTFELRSDLGPTAIFEPQGELPGVPRMPWSPIEGSQDPTIAMLRAKGFAAGAGLEGGDNSQYFRDQAATIIRGLLHAAALDETTTLEDVVRWSMNPSDIRPERILRHHSSMWAERLTQHREATGKSRDTIQNVVSGALDCFNDPRVLKACSPPRGQQIKPADWLTDTGTLYLVGTRDAQATIAPLFAAIAEDLLYAAKKLALTAPGGRVEPCLYFLGDELPTIAPLPSMPALASDGGGSGIALSMVCQNNHQLQERWGRDGGQALRDSANCKLVLGGTQDVTALRDAQALIGQVQEVSSAASWGGGRASVQENVRRESLVDLAALRTLPTGHALVLLGNMPPVEVTMPAWWERPDAVVVTAGRDRFRARLAQKA